jgi:hypothetical protein
LIAVTNAKEIPKINKTSDMMELMFHVIPVIRTMEPHAWQLTGRTVPATNLRHGDMVGSPHAGQL